VRLGPYFSVSRTRSAPSPLPQALHAFGDCEGLFACTMVRGVGWLTRRRRIGSLYWWAGRDAAYIIGGVGMAAVTAVAWKGLVDPTAGGEKKKKK
jgi:hypothetical protein